MIALLVFTDGRLDCLAATIASAEEKLKGSFGLKRIVNDEPLCSNPENLLQRYIQLGYEVDTNPKRIGGACTIARAWSRLPVGCTHIFHLEGDFIFNEPIPIKDMIAVLDAHPKLAQMALVRQPVNGAEIAAGSIIRACPERYAEQKENGYVWLENNFCFTNNPCIYPFEITRYPYPEKQSWPWGEGEFSAFLRGRGYWFGYWGAVDQEPKVTHIG